jgi:hypothetical protein
MTELTGGSRNRSTVRPTPHSASRSDDVDRQRACRADAVGVVDDTQIVRPGTDVGRDRHRDDGVRRPEGSRRQNPVDEVRVTARRRSRLLEQKDCFSAARLGRSLNNRSEDIARTRTSPRRDDPAQITARGFLIEPAGRELGQDDDDNQDQNVHDSPAPFARDACQ